MSTRRKFLQGLLTGLVPLWLPLPVAGNTPLRDVFTFEEFMWLSALLTREASLDEAIGRVHFQLILEEPYGREHLFQVYGLLRQKSDRIGPGKRLTVLPEDFNEGQQWFITHLLISWYTGVYFHARGNQAVTVRGALMYEKLKTFRSPPTFCSGAPGSWGRPPPGAA